jgi:predicted nucleotidyltransferase
MKKPGIGRQTIDIAIVEPEIQAAVATIVGCTTVQEMYLFGSAADNQMTEKSDIDILLVFSSDQDLRSGQKILETKSPLAPRVVDLVWMSRDEFNKKKVIGGVAYNSVKFGRLLYQRPN